MYVKSGWLTRIAAGIYKFANATPTLFDALASCDRQEGLTYRLAASTALELCGFTHYVPMGRPQAYVETPRERHLPKWMKEYDWDRDLHEFSTTVFDGSLGVGRVEANGLSLCVSSPELAIMECLLLAPNRYSHIDVYYLMESLTTLRAGLVSELLVRCSSVKVKRLFLYMAEKANHPWFARLDLSCVTLGAGPRSFVKGGTKVAKYNIIIPQELANL